ncbi:MAG TPA: BON domain-containing protein [Bryobacteraceae bacterium]|jgi:hypothetical protein|nr:BON domain-containing protein [Bryobacteraceae bacterium]
MRLFRNSRKTGPPRPPEVLTWWWRHAAPFALLSRIVFLGMIVLSVSCSKADRDKADRKAEEAKAKAQHAAHETGQKMKQLGRDAKMEARRFDASAKRALQGGGTSSDRETGSLNGKLDEAGHKARDASRETASAVDRAALIAQVKSKLVADAGLSTLTSVSVDTSGQVVTLKGTVSSEQQKRLAEEAAMQVNGVSKVVDDLTVRE